MTKHSTIIFKLSKLYSCKKSKKSFIDKCVNEEFSPSEKTIKNIMDFANEHKKKNQIKC